MKHNDRNIVLIGFMGTGKTTIGRKLAERLKRPFVDTDETIERNANRSIDELFRTEGESFFRDLETVTIRQVLETKGQVVSTGGGSVLRAENRDIMLAHSFVVALKAPADVIVKRLSGDHTRPLLAGDKEKRIRLLMEERKSAYDFAHLAVDTSEFSIHDTVNLIIDRYC